MGLVNIDKGILIALPIIFCVSLIIIPDIFLPYTNIMLISIYVSLLILYRYRNIYGFSGIQLLSVPSTMLLTFTVFIALPSIYVTGVATHESKIPFFISIIAFYYLFPFGILLGNKFKSVDIIKINTINRIVIKSKNDKYYYELLLVLFSVCLGILSLYLFRVDTIPLFELIKDPGDSQKFFYLREDALKTLNMSFIEKYAVHWLRSLFIPIGVVGSLFLTSEYKNRKYKSLFVSFLVLGLFANSMTLEKSPLATVFLVIASYYFLKTQKISMLKLISLILIVLSGPIIITYFLFIDREDVFEVIYMSYFNRLILIPSQVLSYYFEYFPEKHDFLLGRSSQLFSWMSIHGTFPISNFVAKIWWNNPATTGNANAIYLGNFWADFGYLGTFISTPIIGMVSQLFQYKLIETARYQLNIVYITIAAICVPIFTFGFFSSNFTILFFTKGMFLIVLALFLINKSRLGAFDKTN